MIAFDFKQPKFCKFFDELDQKKRDIVFLRILKTKNEQLTLC